MLNVQDVKDRIKAIPAAGPLVDFVRERRLLAFTRRALRSPLPQKIIIELTNTCNLRCAKCPTYEANRARGEMTPELFEKIMQDIARAKAPTKLEFCGGGEDLLHPNFVDFIRLARSIPNIRSIGFTSNGLGLEPSLSARVLEAGVTNLKVSMDTTDPATYFKLNRVNGYEQAVGNIKEFCRLKRDGQYKCQVTLKVSLYKQDDALAARLRELWACEVDTIRITGLHNWLGLRGKFNGMRTQPCDLVWSQVQILWNGQVTLCCMDSMEGFYNMGNMQEMSLSDYWTHNPGLAEVRAAHLRRDFSGLKVCASCQTPSPFHLSEPAARASS